MNCEILRTLYLKSNGEVPCNDHAGERVLLGVVDAADPSWSIADVFGNDPYGHIRASFAAGEVPWDGICQRCAFLRPDSPTQDQLAQRKLTKLQVEPSLACNLRCPCCTNQKQQRERSKPHVMPLPSYERTLRSLRAERFKLKTIEYCGQGEPLTHPRFPEFVTLARRYFPRTRQRLITNGNFDYQAALGGVTLDEIYVSCDGVRQQSYARYRRQGQVDRVLQFMGDAAAAVGKRPAVIWKYILFEFNDSHDELHEAQLEAERLGVDTLLFTVTTSEHRSRTYTPDTLARLPIVRPNVHLEHCTTFQKGAAYGRRLATRFEPESWAGRLAGWCRRPPSWARLDEVLCLPGDVLTLRGWAAATQRLTHVQVYCDDQPVGNAKLTSLRTDLFTRRRHFLRQRAGFYLSVPLLRPLSPQAQISIELLDDRTRRGRLVETYEIGPPQPR